MDTNVILTNYIICSCHLCAILNGISGVTICAGPPLISSQWFPTSERTTATSINLAFNMLGNGLSMLLGPRLVHTPANNHTAVEHVRHEIDLYMYSHAGVAVTLFVLFCVYFPSKPPHPPAPSSAIQRTQFLPGIKALLGNRNVLLACFAYSISQVKNTVYTSQVLFRDLFSTTFTCICMQGVMGSWLGVMVNNFRPLGISDETIGQIGLFSVLSQCLCSIGIGFFTDRFLKEYFIDF